MDNKLIEKKDSSLAIVKQHNALTEAHYDMSALQKNILYLLIVGLKEDDPVNTQYKLSIQEIQKIRNIRLNKQEVKQAVNKFLLKELRIYDEVQQKFIMMGVLSSVKYEKEKSSDYFLVRFDPKLYPFLYNVKSRFTTFNYINASNFKSKYSKRIYEMLNQWKNSKGFKDGITKVFIITVEELKFRLGLIDRETNKETYSDFGIFDRKVLQVAQKEINEQSDISFTYTTKKTGRKVTTLEFHFEYTSSNSPFKEKAGLENYTISTSKSLPSTNANEEISPQSTQEYVYKKLTQEQYQLYKRLRELALDKRLATLVVKDIPTKELESEINDFYNSVTQRKNKTTITPHFEDLLYRYAGIRVRQNYKKVGLILKKEPTDMPPKESNSVKEIDPVYTFCFNTLRGFGINYADIQLLLTQASLDEVKIFLEEVRKELEKNKEPNKADYVIKKFYMTFGSTHTKISEQDKVQTLSQKLKNSLYPKEES
ncbi:MAG: replication initiation protein [Candidatus Amoebophilus sp.]